MALSLCLCLHVLSAHDSVSVCQPYIAIAFIRTARSEYVADPMDGCCLSFFFLACMRKRDDTMSHMGYVNGVCMCLCE